MTVREILAELEKQIDEISPEECIDLLGPVEQAKARLWSRIVMPVSVEPQQQAQEKLTVEEVAQELRMKPSWVREKARTGELEGYKSGKEWRFQRQAVDRFQATLEGKPLTPERENRTRKLRGHVGIFQSKSRRTTHGG